VESLEGPSEPPSITSIPDPGDLPLAADEEVPSPETLGVQEGTAETDRAMLEMEAEPTPSGPPRDGTAADFKEYEAWFTRNGLDLNREGMLEEDPDRDGYSNRDEFLADTDPKDPSSHPGYHPVMRLREMRVVEAPLRLEEVSGSKAKVKNTETGEVVSVRTGDTIPGTSMKVGRIVRRIETDKWGAPNDLSSLTAVDEATGDEMVFIRDMPTRSSESYAELTSGTDPAVSVKIRQGEEFRWPGEPDRSYLVIDMRPTQVVVRETDTGDTWTIPLQ
jgi:hypothetical protein